MLLRDHLSSPLDFYLERIDLGLGLHHRLLNALGKEILLRLNHLMRHRAKVKQVKDIDLEDLKVGELIQRVLKLISEIQFSLFSPKLSLWTLI